MSNLREIPQQPHPKSQTLFRMKLRAKNIVLIHHAGKFISKIAGS
jgi:hypothetical protein